MAQNSATESTISKFKSTLSGGGARPNLFEVILTPPTALQLTSLTADSFSILCKAAALPASNIGSIDVPFRGRIFKVAGDRTYDTWTVTVINDENFAIRTAMESWMQTIGQYGDSAGVTNPNSYMATAKVNQLIRSATNKATTTGAQHTIGKSYIFYDIFPTNISAIDLSYESTDQIEEFTVEFQVQYWAPSELTNTGTAAASATA